MSSYRNVNAKCGCNTAVLLGCVLYTNWDICIYGSQNNCRRAPSCKNVMVFVWNISLVLLGSWFSLQTRRFLIFFFKLRKTVGKVHSKVLFTATLLFWALLHHSSHWKALLAWIRMQDPTWVKKMLCRTGAFWCIYVSVYIYKLIWERNHLSCS